MVYESCPKIPDLKHGFIVFLKDLKINRCNKKCLFPERLLVLFYRVNSELKCTKIMMKTIPMMKLNHNCHFGLLR